MCFDSRHHRDHPARRPFQTRREMLRNTSTGFGFLALQALIGDGAFAGLRQEATDGPLAAKPPHFAPKVKNVILCYIVRRAVSHRFVRP